MDSIIFTPRLKLTLVSNAEKGGPELEWLRELRTDDKATFWSIYGKDKSMEDTQNYLDSLTVKEQNSYIIPYAVHEIIAPASGNSGDEEAEKATRFIGMVTLRSFDVAGDAERHLAIPEHLVLPRSEAATTLTLEIGYMFLPFAWNKGYATEAVVTTFVATKRAQQFWTPFSKVYVRGIVHEENVGSLRVLEKAGMERKGIYEWTGEPIFHGGKARAEANLHIFGLHLLE
ncbi:GNAT domain-containing protein [Podospora didyma]|uniref:GNAT domain-containing protein n=1 Tax=Podospora didyma TaxID=330526 RepID=A0AAE0TZW1_9PEZI|nr:GNAT domain-containing protein [Podospora didyma]